MCNQISIFDGNNKLKIDLPVRLIELFGGIGAQAKALENLNVNFEHYRLCEFDKYAVASYNAIHNTNFETSDICNITANDLGITDTKHYCYIMTYSYPCQDLSILGKMKGMAKGSNTRSSLLWEVERLLDECKELPQILLMENVPEVIGEKNINHFAIWLKKLDSLGYKSKWALLNAKDYGVPQNRNRLFMVSYLGDYYYDYPDKIKLKKTLQDLLLDKVDKKYFLSDKIIKCFLNENSNYPRRDRFLANINKKNKHIANAITTREGNRPENNYIITEPKLIGGIGEKKSNNNTQYYQQDRVYDANGVAMCHPSSMPYGSYNYLIKSKIRRLTPLETFRLMGFSDADYEKASKVNSDCQLYKQTGNSIVVDVLMAIFRQML